MTSRNALLALLLTIGHVCSPACAATTGKLVGWGSNGSEETTVPTGNDFVAIAAGGYHNLALKSDGSLFAWGWNDYGQTNVPAGTGFTTISTGAFHNLALRPDGTLASWEENIFGQSDAPAGKKFVAIAAGGGHSLAIQAVPEPASWKFVAIAFSVVFFVRRCEVRPKSLLMGVVTAR